MLLLNRRETLILLLGDIVCLVVSLFLALFLRGFELPSATAFVAHLFPFSILFSFSLLIFFIAGLYEKHTVLFQGRLPKLLFNVQLTNTGVALAFFYLVPFFGLTPKTILVLYIVTSAVALYLWRLYGRSLFAVRRRQKAILIGSGPEYEELKDEINRNPRYPFTFETSIDLDHVDPSVLEERIVQALSQPVLMLAVVDSEHEKLRVIGSRLHSLIGARIAFSDFSDVYENVFDRMALRNLNASLFVEQAGSRVHIFYDLLKRLMDLVLGFFLTVGGLAVFPFVYFFIKLDDGGSVFIPQIRIGERGERVTVYKLRTMTSNNARSSAWVPEERSLVTRVGRILRQTSLDEVPQVFNVFKGTMSLIGPRADIEGLGERLSREIPNYALRTLIRPGISGWAQIQQLYKKGNISPQSVEETTLRLAYDLYYIKNRSIFLDLKIALRTITILISRIFA